MLPKFDVDKDEYRVQVEGNWYTVLDYRQVETMMRLAHGPDAWIACAAPQGQTVYIRSGLISVIRKGQK